MKNITLTQFKKETNKDINLNKVFKCDSCGEHFKAGDIILYPAIDNLNLFTPTLMDTYKGKDYNLACPHCNYVHLFGFEKVNSSFSPCPLELSSTIHTLFKPNSGQINMDCLNRVAIQVIQGEKQTMTETNNIWTTNEQTINTIHLPGGETIEVEGPITSLQVRDEVKAIGTAKFTVKDKDGNPLPPSKFPVNGDVFVAEYNEAKVGNQ